jgi:hypothetical protein
MQGVGTGPKNHDAVVFRLDIPRFAPIPWNPAGVHVWVAIPETLDMAVLGAKRHVVGVVVVAFGSA